MSNKVKLIKSIQSLVVDFILTKGPVLLMAFVGGSGMTYLAKVSAPLVPYGPVAWASIGLVSFFLICLSLAFIGMWLEKKALSKFTSKIVETATTNPLSPSHSDRKINLIDFYHPFYKATQNVRFERCDLMGPANLYSEGGSFDNCAFNDCEIVIVRDDRPIRGVVPLVRPMFLNCHLYRITFLMPITQYQALPSEMKKGVPIISDGRIGDI
ncbi:MULTISPECIES: hypothetical protein [unclassified Vibrio]|uniref:hypothetical protein n=1 Tax=unclassified Vibrio TaxID=2614977 RepID=UPI0021CFC256|nr:MULTISPECIES: hypothetical protein [unclassified Vibrio]EIC9817015.1 hypothetical protein [Vibrio alginolyticus]MDW1604940.1 hypothetical protein [Vibrio sp. Vb2977]MDW1667914.1 hypothetical protein [Vibrio sp. Vb2978]MDW1681828.1 hypothetical protein [Vibrio sp. Vb2942]